MAERERSLAPPRGGVFVPRAQVMSADDLRRALTRIAHEIVEAHQGLDHVVLVGLQTGGVPLAAKQADVVPVERHVEGADRHLGALDLVQGLGQLRRQRHAARLEPHQDHVVEALVRLHDLCLLYTSPSPRD